MLQYITLFDTSVTSDNLGDEVIMEAVNHEMRELFPKGFIIRIPTHDRIGALSRGIARKGKLSFVGGTNLLSANWFISKQWKIGLRDFWRIGNPILFGVGWKYYQSPTEFLTRWMLKYLLSDRYIHSVRDSYTLKRLHDIGITNVINTGCPTMWRLTPQYCAGIPAKRARNALVTVTWYRGDVERDRKWLDMVFSCYRNVYFWPQQFGDLAYIRRLTSKPFIVLDTNLHAYDDALERLDVDFIGTRLHGGIRALQHSRRALIIEVDNRATEIARDTGLHTMKRDDTEAMMQWITNPTPIRIVMPWHNIDKWQKQFGYNSNHVLPLFARDQLSIDAWQGATQPG